MSRRRNYSPETIHIMERFFEAIATLIELKKLRGIQTYCNAYGIAKRNWYTQREDLNKGYFEMSWMLPLITDFKVSSNWLLFGKGKIFKSE